MEADLRDPTDYGLTSFSVGGTKKDRTMAKRAVHPLRGDMAQGGALERFLRLFDTRDYGIGVGVGMQKHDVATLSERLNELSEGLNARPVSKVGLSLWTAVLKDFPIDWICDAFSQWAREKTKFPAPAEIAKICAARVSERIEREAVTDKAQFAAGARQVMGDPRVAQLHLGRIRAILKLPSPAAAGMAAVQGPDLELEAEREAILHQDDPLR